jgi:DNA-binding transcriptional LysR family regulator
MKDWNDLRFFLALARADNMIQAAKQLEVNQSTVYRRLNGFESRLGVRLFERLPSGLQLNQAGEELLQSGLRIEKELQQIDLRLSGQDARLSGTIKITSTENIGCYVLPRHFSRFKNLYPSINLELLIEFQSLDLSQRTVDVAIRPTRSPPEDLIGRKITDMRWAVCASAHYQRIHGVPAKVEDLSGHPVIMPSPELSRIPAFRWLQEQSFAGAGVCCNSISAMSALAKEGLGLAILPSTDASLLSGQLDPLLYLSSDFDTGLWILYLKELRDTARIQTFVNFMVDSLRADVRLTL